MPHCRVRFGSTQCGKIPAPVGLYTWCVCGWLLRNCVSAAPFHDGRARLAEENEPQEVDGERGHCRRLRVYRRAGLDREGKAAAPEIDAIEAKITAGLQEDRTGQGLQLQLDGAQ